MKYICEKNLCTGCCACENVCLRQAISMTIDERGFIFPNIDSDKCVDCGLCKSVCPILSKIQLHTPIVAYRGSIDGVYLHNSTSGGVFPALAKQVIDNNGCVVGAFLNESFEVKHIIINKLEDIKLLQGSKYVGSNLSEIYKRIKEIINNDITVLFTGTPCQVAGLKNYLNLCNVGEKISNLFTCDFICHGVGSQKIFDKFLSYEQVINGSKIIDVKFRSKIKRYSNSCMVLSFADGSKKIYPSYRNAFGYAFSIGMINRLSCSKCKFAQINRVSDVTFADCIHGLSRKEKKDGCSYIIVNSIKGALEINKLRSNLDEISLESIVSVQPHLSRPQKAHNLREKIMNDIDKDFVYLYKNYLIPPKRNILKSLKERIRYAIKKTHNC